MSTTCGACNGSGLCDIDGSPCGACNGSGELEEYDPANEEIARLRRENERLRGALESITSEFERTVREADRPRGGQHVTPGGDFVAAIRSPSFVGRARWWARELRAALGGQS